MQYQVKIFYDGIEISDEILDIGGNVYTLEDFIYSLLSLKKEYRSLPVVIYAPNGLEFRPCFKVKYINDDIQSGPEKIIIIHKE